MRGVRPPKLGAPEIHPLTAAEVRRLLDHYGDTVAGRLFTVAILTGLRKGELLGLGWSDVDLDGASLRVGRSLQYQRGAGLVLKPGGKTAGSRRTVLLAEPAVAALRAQRAYLAACRERLGPAWTEQGLVFPGETGGPRNLAAVNRLLHRALAQVHIAPIRFHDLRHTCATLLLAAGTHPKVVSELLGHSSVSLTLNVYSHYLPALHAEAADALAAALEAGRGTGSRAPARAIAGG